MIEVLVKIKDGRGLRFEVDEKEDVLLALDRFLRRYKIRIIDIKEAFSYCGRTTSDSRCRKAKLVAEALKYASLHSPALCIY